ncbi:unnamed protein product [Trichogramma brassicae]|uniref:Uncharacterized protein n=1 Tax=Trichogramma brassicae TaxID=86971 RepID=A0A6H5HWE9_9HYME|nr:unnamed protein product [Trichogramma brassicae]
MCDPRPSDAATCQAALARASMIIHCVRGYNCTLSKRHIQSAATRDVRRASRASLAVCAITEIYRPCAAALEEFLSRDRPRGRIYIHALYRSINTY